MRSFPLNHPDKIIFVANVTVTELSNLYVYRRLLRGIFSDNQSLLLILPLAMTT